MTNMKATMQKSIGFLMCLALLSGCTTTGKNAAGAKAKLEIRWQRLVDDKGQTCGRCGTTEAATVDAAKKLRRSLKPLNIDVA